MEDEEYDLSDSEDESVSPAPTTSDSIMDEGGVVRALTMSKASGPELESEHSEWFEVEPDDPKIPGKFDDSETEEDNDSDDHDLNEPDTVEEDDDNDEWFSIRREEKVVSSTTMGTQSSEGFDAVRAPQIQDTIVGSAPSPTFSNV